MKRFDVETTRWLLISSSVFVFITSSLMNDAFDIRIIQVDTTLLLLVSYVFAIWFGSKSESRVLLLTSGAISSFPFVLQLTRGCAFTSVALTWILLIVLYIFIGSIPLAAWLNNVGTKEQ